MKNCRPEANIGVSKIGFSGYEFEPEGSNDSTHFFSRVLKETPPHELVKKWEWFSFDESRNEFQKMNAKISESLHIPKRDLTGQRYLIKLDVEDKGNYLGSWHRNDVHSIEINVETDSLWRVTIQGEEVLLDTIPDDKITKGESDKIEDDLFTKLGPKGGGGQGVGINHVASGFELHVQVVKAAGVGPVGGEVDFLRGVEGTEVGPGLRLACALEVTLQGRIGQGGEDADDHHNDHHLDQTEATAPSIAHGSEMQEA